MKKILLLIALTLAAFLAAQAQELEVKEFEHDPFNTYATYHQKLDYSGDPCGVILLSLPDPNAKFEGSIMYDYLTYDHGEWVIYMTKGAKYLTIKTEKYAPVRYDFPEGLAIQGNVTYIMVVQMPRQMTDEEMLAYLEQSGALKKFGYSRNDRSSDDSDNGDTNKSALVTEGISYFEAKNYTEALRCYRQAAEQGDPEGQVRLGNLYYHGQGVTKNDEEAVKWYRKAANQGFAWGQNNLGISYRDGEGVAQDEAEAVKWVRKAAEQNFDKGQTNLGLMYCFGQGVKQDYNEAVKWFRKAAEQGSAWGQFLLGCMYYDGTGVPKDYAEATKWYRKAADQDEPDAQNSLGVMYENGFGVPQDYAEAIKWYRKAAEQDNARGQYNLGTMYDYGHGVAQDYAEAVKWYRKAAEQDDPDGQCNLGIMYELGQGVAENYTEAMKWFRKSAEQDNARGQFHLGLMYEFALGVKENSKEAAKWYRKAAEQDNVAGMRRLGILYKEGSEVKQDYKEAAYWLRKAAEQGDAESQWNLGEMYLFGYGVEENLVEGVELIRKSAEQGNEMGQVWLGALYQDGLGVPQDNTEAAKWYQKAADQGFEGALELLAGLENQPSSEPVETSNGLTFTVEGVSFTMKLVEGGKFLMGAQKNNPNGKNYDNEAAGDESPVHSVTLSTFFMGETEVTQALWLAVMGNNPSYYKGDDLPVEMVTWNDCQEFIRKLNQMTNQHFRLPTEAEWEYAARGGKYTHSYKYSGSNKIDEVAWYWRNSGDHYLSGEYEYGKADENHCKTHPVKTVSPNELGLYDMSGNVWEMCSDWNGGKVYYEKSPSKNPQGPESGWERVMRGGAYNNMPDNCRVSLRSSNGVDDGGPIIGFRLALDK